MNKNNNPNPCYPTAYVLDINNVKLGTNGNINQGKIIIKYSSNKRRCGTDSGLGSKIDLSYFKPALGPNQFWFGHYIVPANT